MTGKPQVEVQPSLTASMSSFQRLTKSAVKSHSNRAPFNLLFMLGSQNCRQAPNVHEDCADLEDFARKTHLHRDALTKAQTRIREMLSDATASTVYARKPRCL